MADVHSKEQRSRNMAAIKSRDTKPEMRLRSLLHKMGYRYRLHRKDLPGKPDIVFPARKKVLFMHGCYWHMHDCRYGKVIPKTNADFWQNKRMGNAERDIATTKKLAEMGWDIMIIWECETRQIDQLIDKICIFLGPSNSPNATIQCG